MQNIDIEKLLAPVDSRPLHIGMADVNIEHKHGQIIIGIVRAEDERYIELTMPMDVFKECLTMDHPAETEVGDPWWHIRYSNPHEDRGDTPPSLSQWKCRAHDILAAGRLFNAKFPGFRLEEAMKSDLEPWSLWLPRAPGATYPKHAMRVLKAEGGMVDFVPAGGGNHMSGPIRRFLAEFEYVTESMKEKVKVLKPAFFSLPTAGPTIMGFTYGELWNGWGCPLFERNTFLDWMAEFEPGDCFFGADADGGIFFDDPSTTEDRVMLESRHIDYEGETYSAVDAQCGLCWGQVDICEDPDSMDPEGWQSLMEAIAPKGFTWMELQQQQ